MENIFDKRQAQINAFLENRNKLVVDKREIPEHMFTLCKGCGKLVLTTEYQQLNHICPLCNYHDYIPTKERLKLLGGTYEEILTDITTIDFSFPGYKEKIIKAQAKTKLKEALSCYVYEIDGRKIALGIMDSAFMMASMGKVVGEKFCLLAELALKKKIPLVVFCASGGARMQEQIISLMQMAKTAVAIKNLRQAKIPYVSIITNPTYGGVSASFASLADIILAEPNSLYGFAGRRVIENTIKEKLPQDFQTTAKALETGQIDMIVERNDLTQTLVLLLKYLGG